MADKGTITNQQEKILKALILFPEGASIEEIQKAADIGIDKRQFQRRLNTLIESGQINRPAKVEVLNTIHSKLKRLKLRKLILNLNC